MWFLECQLKCCCPVQKFLFLFSSAGSLHGAVNVSQVFQPIVQAEQDWSKLGELVNTLSNLFFNH